MRIESRRFHAAINTINYGYYYEIINWSIINKNVLLQTIKINSILNIEVFNYLQ